jgi:hypothetical protein
MFYFFKSCYKCTQKNIQMNGKPIKMLVLEKESSIYCVNLDIEHLHVV